MNSFNLFSALGYNTSSSNLKGSFILNGISILIGMSGSGGGVGTMSGFTNISFAFGPACVHTSIPISNHCPLVYCENIFLFRKYPIGSS